MDRRTFMTAAAAIAASQLPGVAPANAQTASGSAPTPSSGEPKFRIAMIIFDGMTNQDFVGPNDIFARCKQVEIDVLAKAMDPVKTDARGRILPDKALRDAADHYDMLFIGGGGGATAMMEDAEVIAFLQSRAPKAKYITSVCTGALVLGSAGLLKGYKAATHWAAMGVLPLLGAIPTKQRVVIDRNRITGGGVTAGIDFGLTVVAELWGAEQAQTIQLGMEYDPHPPFDAGSPDKAPPAILAKSKESLARMTGLRMDAAHRIEAKWKS
jgi:cyclohexyl-isocyanide hydratase